MPSSNIPHDHLNQQCCHLGNYVILLVTIKQYTWTEKRGQHTVTEGRGQEVTLVPAVRACVRVWTGQDNPMACMCVFVLQRSSSSSLLELVLWLKPESVLSLSRIYTNTRCRLFWIGALSSSSCGGICYQSSQSAVSLLHKKPNTSRHKVSTDKWLVTEDEWCAHVVFSMH